MRNSLSTRSVHACAAGALFFSLALTPAFANISAPFAGRPARTASAPRHFAPLGFRGFNRIGVNRFGFNRFGFDRLGHDKFAFDRFGSRRFGFNRFRFNRFGLNANALDFGLLGLDGEGYWGYPPSYPIAPAAPIMIGAGSPPVAMTLYTGDGAGAGDVRAADWGACPVIYRLNYDEEGHYVGERQIPAC